MSTPETAQWLVEHVWQQYDGKAPMRDGEIDLDAIVMAVLKALADRGYIELVSLDDIEGR